MGISRSSEIRKPLVRSDSNIPLKKLILALIVCCFGFFACEINSVFLFLKGEPNLQMQVLWPLKETPEEFVLMGSGSGLTIELKTNVERIEAFIEGQKIEASSVFMTTLERLAKPESIPARPWRGGGIGYYGKFPSIETDKITYFDLIPPVLSSSGPKILVLVGWLGPNKIEKTIKISYDPERLDQLARSFLKQWWCKEGKSLRFQGNIIRWKSELPKLNPYIRRATGFLSRWWLGTISFVEDQLNPDIIIKQSDQTLPFSMTERISDTIGSGTIFVPHDILTWLEETIIHCIAHELGHCLGISVAAGIHPPNDSFMGPDLLNFRWHPYQRRSASLIYSHPAGTKF